MCIIISSPRRISDTTNARLIIDLQKIIMQLVPVQRATAFSQLTTQSYCGCQCNGQHLRSIQESICNICRVARTGENKNFFTLIKFGSLVHDTILKLGDKNNLI